MLKTRFLCAMFMVMQVLEGTKGCCMFDQWEGVTVSVEREFDAVQGGVYERVTTERHYYDFTNSRVASRDVQTGKFILKDFKEGIAIVPKGNSCLKIPINENMARSCLPKDATFLGKHFIGVDVPVNLWTANNHTSHLVVLQNTCIPVSEETFQTNGPHSLVIFTYFYNVTLGIKHEQVFSVPDSCSEPDQDEIDFVHKINEHLEMRKKSFTV